MTTDLQDKLAQIDWTAITTNSLKENSGFSDIQASCKVMTTWLNELCELYEGNYALSFLKEAYVSINDYSTSMSIALYKLSAASMRTILESILYYSYFKDHPKELHTLINDSSYYLTRSDILEYHYKHTNNFKVGSRELNLISSMDNFYSEVSAIIHGQIPGVWQPNVKLDNRSHCKKTFNASVEHFKSLASIINHFLILHLTEEEWQSINIRSRELFLKGLKPQAKITIKRT